MLLNITLSLVLLMVKLQHMLKSKLYHISFQKYTNNKVGDCELE